jgi:hypothetical protein
MTPEDQARRVLREHPAWPDAQIAEAAEVPLDVVRAVRRDLRRVSPAYLAAYRVSQGSH